MILVKTIMIIIISIVAAGPVSFSTLAFTLYWYFSLFFWIYNFEYVWWELKLEIPFQQDES